MIDYGCGSGILGIAALKMGAAHVIAVDLGSAGYPTATRDNALRNGVSSAIEVQGVPAQVATGELRGCQHSLRAIDRFGADIDRGL